MSAPLGEGRSKNKQMEKKTRSPQSSKWSAGINTGAWRHFFFILIHNTLRCDFCILFHTTLQPYPWRLPNSPPKLKDAVTQIQVLGEGKFEAREWELLFRCEKNGEGRQRSNLCGMQEGTLRASEERSGEQNQGCWVDFHMEELFKVKVRELLAANES